MTRVKFRVASLTKYQDYSAVALDPVTAGSEENNRFFKYTPGGRIEMNVINHDALTEFEPGTEFYVDFTKA